MSTEATAMPKGGTGRARGVAASRVTAHEALKADAGKARNRKARGK